MMYGEFPRIVTVGKEKTVIDPDFRIFCAFEDQIRGNGDGAAAIAAFYRGRLPSDAKGAVNAFLDFYLCGEKPKEKSKGSRGGSKGFVYSFSRDRNLFIAAFLQQYRIDLCTARLHWWEFCALFSGLTDDTMLVRVMQIRGTDTNKIKDKHERSRIRELQERFSLSNRGGKRKYATAEERSAAMLEEVRARRAEVEKLVKTGGVK